MTPQSQAWSRELREFISDRRRKRPYRDRSKFRDDEEWHYRIIGGGIISWLRHCCPYFMRERAFFADLRKFEKDPTIVFTSNEPGLVAAREILGDDFSGILSLYPTEYASWLKKRPDDNFQWHIHTWSYFSKLDKETLAKAQKNHRISSGESYWLEKEGTMHGELAGIGADHLWKWNGKKPILIEGAINQWVS